MTPAILALLVLQAVPAAPPPRRAAARPFAYRGFTPGMSYRDFATRARVITPGDSDQVVCQTMHNTAQVMDCGVNVRDPVDSARFYLSANVIEGQTSVISLVDSGGVSLVKRRQDDVRAQLGAPTRRLRSTWEWTRGRRFIRLSWRGGGDATGSGWRKISITLNDLDAMNRIRKYVPRHSTRRPPPPAAPARKP
jgi:hypothetical protein